MAEQTDETKELSDFDDLRDSYSIEDKLFNMTASQMSEPFRKSLRRDF